VTGDADSGMRVSERVGNKKRNLNPTLISYSPKELR
jgi:hypothetical protein